MICFAEEKILSQFEKLSLPSKERRSLADRIAAALLPSIRKALANCLVRFRSIRVSRNTRDRLENTYYEMEDISAGLVSLSR